jgi:hypothetical protein
MIDVAKALKVIGETVYKMGAFIEPEITIVPDGHLHEEGKDAPTVTLKITFFSPIRLHEYIAQLTPQEVSNG